MKSEIKGYFDVEGLFASSDCHSFASKLDRTNFTLIHYPICISTYQKRVENSFPEKHFCVSFQPFCVVLTGYNLDRSSAAYIPKQTS
mmetsp:Transcript_3651/g.7107  ORF Transcript_3651/g.7107 Transcript_3651/m.7107 type:complete len:87 (+) Transcript_3651:375-635(+)